MTIREAVRELVKDVATNKCVRIGKAVNIDKDKCLCDVDLGNDAILYGVKLKSVEGDKDKGLVIIPREDTMVCAAMLEGVEANWTIVQHSEIESWQITTDGGAVVTVSDDGKVYLNGKDHEGLVKVSALVDKLNAIIDDVNNLKLAFSTWVPVVQDGGAALKSATGSWFGQRIDPAQKSDIENQNVQHGNGA